MLANQNRMRVAINNRRKINKYVETEHFRKQCL